jgi:fumarate hydratase subunit alpha
MKEIHAAVITDVVKDLAIQAACDLGEDMETLLRGAIIKEESEFGKYALQQILDNAELARKEMVPMCQDTGIAVVFVELGQDVHIVGGSLEEAINEGVRRGYTEGYLRKSIVKDPVFARKNTGDNTPAVIHLELIPGDRLKIMVAPKGGGSENMGALKMLKPAEGLGGVKDFVVKTVKEAGGNPCPPIVVGVGIGGTMEKATILAKKALTRKAGEPNQDPDYAKLEQDLLGQINRLGIGPQGFGGKVTALAVHIETYPTHLATMPVAVNINCHASRHVEAVL